MSLCYRALPRRFTSLVNARKHGAKIDRQLPGHGKPSFFLKQFFDAKPGPVRGVNLQRRMPESATTSQRNLPLVTLTIWEKQPGLPSNGCKNNDRLLRVKRYKSACDPYQDIIDYGATENAGLISKDIHYVPLLSKHQEPLANLQNNSLAFSTESPVQRIKGIREERLVLTSPILKAEQQNGESPTSNTEKKPEDGLTMVYETLRKDIPQMFNKHMDYSIYTQDLVFVNNIRGITSSGLAAYVKDISILRIIGHIKYAYIKMNVLKITIHPEDNSVKVRWRISGIGGLKVLLMFWKFKVWNLKDCLKDQEMWYDGFSTFYVNLDGKVYKHVVDKVMPDQDTQKVEKTKTPIAAKLALFLGLFDSYDQKFLYSKKSTQPEMLLK